MWQITIEQAFSIKSYKWYLLKFSFFAPSVIIQEVSWVFSFFRDFLICKYALGSNICKFILICLFSSALPIHYLKASKHFAYSHKFTVCVFQNIARCMNMLLCAYFSILKVPKRKNRFRLSGFIFHFSPSNSAL